MVLFLLYSEKLYVVGKVNKITQSGIIDKGNT